MVGKRLKLLASGLCLFSLLLVAGCAEAESEAQADFGVVLEKVKSASSQVSSYRSYSTSVGVSKGLDKRGEVQETKFEGIEEGAYMSPDREWGKRSHKYFTSEREAQEMPFGIWEAFYIGNKSYERDYDEGEEPGLWKVRDLEWTPGGWFAVDGVLWGYSDSLINVEQLPSEKVNGTKCLHYKGKVDMNQFWDWMYLARKVETWEPEMRKTWEKEREWWMLWDRTVELWIGKDDYLIRKYKYHGYNPYSSSSQLSDPSKPKSSLTSTEVIEFYDYNEAIEIEPPI